MILLLLAVAALAVGAGPVAVVDPKTVWDDWSTLQLKARKLLFFSGGIQLDVRQTSGKQVLETESVARFLGQELSRTRTTTTIDPETGRILELVSLSRKRGRHYEFGERGYTVKRLVPTNGHRAPLEEWEVKSEQKYVYPAADPSGAATRVFDYYGMLLELGHVQLERPGDEVKFCVATSKGPRIYRVWVGETRDSTRTFRDLRSGEERTLPVRELRLRVAPEDPEAADEGFLNMEGEIELWVESETRTVLELSGKVPNVPGRVHIELSSIG